MDSGDTAWMLMSTALVMIMLPGLALFYGGLVHRKNVLSTVMHSFFGLALVTVVWVIVGFTLAFGPDVPLPILGSGFIGGLDFAMFNNVGLVPSTVYAVTVPFVLFAAFQLMFAAITPALITGAFAEQIHGIAGTPGKHPVCRTLPKDSVSLFATCSAPSSTWSGTCRLQWT